MQKSCARLSRNQRRKQVRAKVLQRYGYMCFYCGCNLGDGGLSLDHVTAESEGGKYEEDNLVPACKDCNQEKGKLDLEGYRLLIWRKRPAGRIVSGIALAVTENITLFSPVEMLALRSIADRIKQDNPMPVFPGELMYRDLPYLMAVEQQGMRVSA